MKWCFMEFDSVLFHKQIMTLSISDRGTNPSHHQIKQVHNWDRAGRLLIQSEPGSVFEQRVRAASCYPTHLSAILFILMITLYLSHLCILMSVLSFHFIKLHHSLKNRVVFSLCLSLDAYESAKLLCEQYYLGAPELELRQMNGENTQNTVTKHTHSFYLWLMCLFIEC